MFWIVALSVIAIASFTAVFFGIYVMLRPTWVRERMREKEAAPATTSTWQENYSHRIETFFKSVGEKIPRPAEELSRQGLRLVQAGIRRKDAPYIYMGIQAMVVVALLLVAAGTGLFRTHPILSLLFAVLGGVALSDIVLKLKINKRREQIQNGLPDTLDLTVICVEAGLGLDQALKRIGDELRGSYPQLSDELNIYHLETRSGYSRENALRNMAKRTGLDDVRSLAAILIQTDRFGTSVGQSLRVFAEGMRTRRRQRAEERAAKIAVKMIPPMVLFVFPSIFVVVAGPAVMMIAQRLLPMLGGS